MAEDAYPVANGVEVLVATGGLVLLGLDLECCDHSQQLTWRRPKESKAIVAKSAASRERTERNAHTAGNPRNRAALVQARQSKPPRMVRQPASSLQPSVQFAKGKAVDQTLERTCYGSRTCGISAQVGSCVARSLNGIMGKPAKFGTACAHISETCHGLVSYAFRQDGFDQSGTSGSSRNRKWLLHEVYICCSLLAQGRPSRTPRTSPIAVCRWKETGWYGQDYPAPCSRDDDCSLCLG